MTKREKNAVDRRIDEIVRRRCSGMPISIMDIPKVFRAAHVALASGGDLETAVVDAYTQLARS